MRKGSKKQTGSRKEKFLRIQFDIPKEESETLDKAVEEVNLKTRADFIRNSLDLYVYLMKAAKQGKQLGVMGKDGTFHSIILLPLQSLMPEEE